MESECSETCISNEITAEREFAAEDMAKQVTHQLLGGTRWPGLRCRGSRCACACGGCAS